MNRHLPLVLAACALSLALPVAAQRAAERNSTSAENAPESLDRTPENCIRTTRIRSTTVIDDETILFYLGRNRIYRNFLERSCPGLKRADRFLWEIQSTQLCSLNNVTVLNQFGTSFQRGFTCALGKFHPITREEAEFMEMDPDEAAALERGVIRNPIDPEQLDEAEEVDADETADAESQ